MKKLIKKHFWDMAVGNSLNTGNNLVLPEDAAIFLEEYFNVLNVEPNGFNFQKYFPNEGIRFFPNALLPYFLKTDHHVALALTLEMLIALAEAGHWLYRD